MVLIHINAKRRPSCFKWKMLLLATVAALVPIIFVQVAQPVSILELESISSFLQTTAEKSESKESPSLSDELHPPRPSYDVIFSTGCSPSQNWQSYFFFYHALAVHQPGSVTRIASGCTAQQEIELYHFHERYIHTMSENFLMHFTPDYSKLRINKKFGSSGDHSYK